METFDDEVAAKSIDYLDRRARDGGGGGLTERGEMRLIAFLTEPSSIRAILAHLGEPITPPVLAPRARAPPELETEWAGTPAFAFDQSPPWDPTTPAPDPGSSFDQTIRP